VRIPSQVGESADPTDLELVVYRPLGSLRRVELSVAGDAPLPNLYAEAWLDPPRGGRG